MKQWVLRNEAALNRAFGEIRPLIEEGRPYHLIFKRYTRRRSVEQNSRMWSMLTAIADYSGDDVQSVKEEMCRRYLGMEAYKILGMARERPRGTSGLNVEEMSDLMAQIEVFMSEWGLTWGEEEHA